MAQRVERMAELPGVLQIRVHQFHLSALEDLEVRCLQVHLEVRLVPTATTSTWTRSETSSIKVTLDLGLSWASDILITKTKTKTEIIVKNETE